MIAILIAHLPERRDLLHRVLTQLDEQRHQYGVDKVVILVDSSVNMTTGQKRNRLLASAEARGASYVAFIDDDDLIGPNYIKHCLECEASGSDCMELWGQYWERGKQMPVFHHSLVHKEWWQDAKGYYRNPNHLNLIKLSLLKEIRFKALTIGEDGQFSLALAAADVLKTMHPVNEILYYYFKNTPDKSKEPQMAMERGTVI